MEDILDLKLKEFPDSEKYKKKASDMKELTKIYKKYQSKEELTKENLRFLYEIDNRIEGFGYQSDPRIEETKKNRNKRKDLALALECLEEEIGIAPESIEGKHFKYYYGDLYLGELTSAEDLILPKSINGDLDLRSLTSAKGLVLPKSINGDLDLRSLTSAKGLVFPKSIGGYLYLNSLTSVEGLMLPENIDGSLYLISLTIEDLIDAQLPVSVRVHILIDNKVYPLKILKSEILSIKKARLNNMKSVLRYQKLQNKNQSLDNQEVTENDTLKRGNINIWYILIPSLTILLGILISYIIYL